jgi:hypothetical protein
MRKLFKITYDVKVNRAWLGGGNDNGFDVRNVITNGDGVAASEKLRRFIYKHDFGGFSAKDCRIIKVELVAGNVL